MLTQVFLPAPIGGKILNDSTLFAREIDGGPLLPELHQQPGREAGGTGPPASVLIQLGYRSAGGNSRFRIPARLITVRSAAQSKSLVASKQRCVFRSPHAN